jgi:hypothetical protein
LPLDQIGQEQAEYITRIGGRPCFLNADANQPTSLAIIFSFPRQSVGPVILKTQLLYCLESSPVLYDFESARSLEESSTEHDLVCNTNFGMAAISNTDDIFSLGLMSFSKSGIPFQSAAPAIVGPTGIRHDFLTFLGIAQSLKIDFLPITWQPALDTVGQGGTAEIRQALINLQTSFAFKRLISTRPAEEAKNFQALIAEISVLGQPSIRDHPNIITLEGICWDIILETEKVWPVLVFEKARLGDLLAFMEQGAGKKLSLEDRLQLCVDIATAVADMHSNCE